MLAVFWFAVAKGRHNAALTFLVIASLFFYSWWDLSFLPILLGSILFNYGVGLWMERETGSFPRRAILAAGIIGNLIILGIFKYAGFFTVIWNDLTHGAVSVPHALLPLGISFYTFQKIAYLCDLHARKLSVPTFRDFSLFVSFFPQLVAGPIVHGRDLLPQLLKEPKVQDIAGNLAIGFGFFAVGLFKKVVIADTLAVHASPVFAQAAMGQDIGFFDAWAAALAYTFQLYFDFSGYSDMAVGLGRMMGIKLPYNFLSPYRASSIIDFWRRWHITMSDFFRDYVYIPLGGNRAGGGRVLANLFTTMLLAGLWHGAGWTFIFWGGLHGAYLIINHLFRRYAGESNAWPRRIGGHIITMLAVVIGWVFFRAADFGAAQAMLSGMMSVGDIALFLGGQDMMNVSLKIVPFLIVCYAMCLTLPNTAEFFDRREGRRLFTLHFTFGMKEAAGLSLLFVLSVFSLQKISEFLYFQF